MYYIRHYWIKPYDKAFQNMLETKYSIDVEILTNANTGLPHSFVFDISDMHPQIDQLNSILPEATPPELVEDQIRQYMNCRGSKPISSVTIIYMPQYTQDELLNAKWLDVRNISSKIDPVNCGTVDRQQCFVKMSKLGNSLGCHEIQNEPYIVKSPIKWGRQAFVSAYTHEERLFCSETARSILESEKLKGIQFLPVIKKSTCQPMDGIYQIIPERTVPSGTVVAVSDMYEYTCDQCGMNMLRWGKEKSRYGLIDGVLDENVDVWYTLPMFLGAEPTPPHSAQRRLIISQRMYQILTNNKLDRGFIFTPLEAVSKKN